MGIRAITVYPECLAVLDQTVARVSPACRAETACKDYQVRKAIQESLDHPEALVRKETQVDPGLPVEEEIQGRWAMQDYRECLEVQETRVTKEYLEFPARKVIPDQSRFQDDREIKEMLDFLAGPELQDQLDFLVKRATEEDPVSRDSP